MIAKLFPNWGDQKDIATLLNVTEPAVSKWWRRGYFPIRQALRLEQAFGINAEDMVEPSLGVLLSNRPKTRGKKKANTLTNRTAS